MTPEGLVVLCVFLIAILILIFVICRKFMLWYWKIEKRLIVQEDILDTLIKINKKI